MSELRAATPDDIPALRALIDASVRGLGTGFYTPEQIDASLRHMFGVDTQLIADGTYYVIEAEGTIVAAGGWSGRRTLFGGDQMKTEEDARLDPATEPARIRAFYVHPGWARRGLARRLFTHCRDAAAAAGFRTLELMATLPGVPFYTTLGFVARERVNVPLPDGVLLPCVRMARPVEDDG
jgi:GNAT superfamily N-acetyltransferase